MEKKLPKEIDRCLQLIQQSYRTLGFLVKVCEVSRHNVHLDICQLPGAIHRHTHEQMRQALEASLHACPPAAFVGIDFKITTSDYCPPEAQERAAA